MAASGRQTPPFAAGVILPFAAGARQDGSLCYGQAVPRTTWHAALFSALAPRGARGRLHDVQSAGPPGRVLPASDDMGGTSANRLTNQTGGFDGDTPGAGRF